MRDYRCNTVLLLIFCCYMPSHSQSPEWIPYEGHEYYFASTRAEFSNAEATCTEMGSTLTSIRNFEEQQFINQQLDPLILNEHIHYWIGLYHADNGCIGCGPETINSSTCTRQDLGVCCDCRLEWQWTDGSSMGYMNWMLNEPTGEDNPCARISRAAERHPVQEGLFWFDFDCNTQSRFICKRVGLAGDIPSDEGTMPRSGEQTASSKSEKKDSNDDGNMTIGIGVGVGVALLAVIAFIVIFFILRRQRQQKRYNNQKQSQDHVYYNEQAPQSSTAEYVNHAAQTKGSKPSAMTETQEPSGTQYAQVILPNTKPKPLTPKPVDTHKVLQYAEIDFEPSGTQSSTQGEYSSVDSLQRQRVLSYEEDTASGYAGIEGENGTSVKDPDQNELKPKPKLTEEDLQAMYAQPVKKNKGDKSPHVMRKPAPNNEGVLYAVPMK